MKSSVEISKDHDHGKITAFDDIAVKLPEKEASVTKQIFIYIFENIFLSTDSMSDHLDIVEEMYSEFLKYAFGGGKELETVLTPPYVIKMMSQILDIDESSKIMDLTTGSAGLLASAMKLMVECVGQEYGKNITKANKKIDEVEQQRLLGVELSAEMCALASTSMVLRGNGSGDVRKGSSFDEPPELYGNFNANVLLLNPPFAFKENSLPFLKLGPENTEVERKAATIIQGSTGSSGGVTSCKEILSKNQLVASIKTPADLFLSMAGVQTSVYILEHTGKEHDYKKQVKFIDFRDDEYKRTKRGIYELSSPSQRYKDIVKAYKNGITANISSELWDIKNQVVMDATSRSGDDWDFE